MKSNFIISIPPIGLSFSITAKKLGLLLFFIANAATLHAQELKVNWTRFIGGDQHDDAQVAIATRDGGIAFSGRTGSSGSGDIPVNTPVPPPFTSKSNLLVGKMDNNKNLAWVKVYGGSQMDMGKSICQLSDGGFGLLAQTQSPEVTGFKGASDMWLLRLDENGDLLWERSFGSMYAEYAISVDTTSDKGFIILGVSAGNGDDVPVHYGDFNFSYDWIVIKVDSNGNKQWAKTLGGKGMEYSTGSIVSAGNNYYLMGSSASTDHDCTDTGWHPSVYTDMDIYILQLDTGGNVIWNRSFGGSHADLAYNAIWDQRDNTLVVTGYTRSNDYMIDTSYGGQDIWLIKTDMAGNLQWARTLGGDRSNDNGECIALGKNNGYLLSSTANAFFNNEPRFFDQNDIWLFALDKDGLPIADEIIGGHEADNGYSIVHFDNSWALVGASSTMAFNIGTSSPNFFGEDAFVTGIDFWPVNVKDGITHENRIIDVYPNPASDQIRIRADNSLVQQIDIRDIRGQQVFSKKVNDAVTEISVNDWARGIYYVQLADSDGYQHAEKLVLH